MFISNVIYEKGGYDSGCNTCDYGSSYITDFIIETENCCMTFEFDTEHNYISESDLMKILSVKYDNEWILINKIKNVIRSNYELADMQIDIKLFLNSKGERLNGIMDKKSR